MPSEAFIMDPATQGEAQGPVVSLDQVLPLLSGLMTPQDWLACFQASKGMGEQVVPHATRTHLTLRSGTAIPAGGNSSSSSSHTGGTSSSNNSGASSKGSSSSGSGSSMGTQHRPNLHLAQQLAAQAHDVTLTLQGGLLTPDVCLQRNITTMRLNRMQLPAPDVMTSTLQLHALPHLHTLGFKVCRVGRHSSNASSTRYDGSVQPAAPSVRTLEVLGCSMTFRDGAEDTDFMSLALSLVDPAQLQAVITDDVTVLDHMGHMRHMPALQELQLLNHIWGESRVCEALQQGLLTQPRLKQLSLGSLQHMPDSRKLPCTLDSLQLLQGASTATLAHLPLASLKSLTVHGKLQVDGHASQALAHMAQCQHLAFQPKVLRGPWAKHPCQWQPRQPAFSLALNNTDVGDLQRSDEHEAQLVSLCLQHMGGTGAAFILHTARLSTAVLASLAEAPPTITTIAFSSCRPPHAPGAAPGVVASLPAHVSHVVVAPSLWEAATPAGYVKGVDRSLRITLVSRAEEWGREKRQVQHWLAENASGKLQLDFQTTPKIGPD